MAGPISSLSKARFIPHMGKRVPCTCSAANHAKHAGAVCGRISHQHIMAGTCDKSSQTASYSATCTFCKAHWREEAL